MPVNLLPPRDDGSERMAELNAICAAMPKETRGRVIGKDYVSRKGTCKRDGCYGKRYAAGLCRVHYRERHP